MRNPRWIASRCSQNLPAEVSVEKKESPKRTTRQTSGEPGRPLPSWLFPVPVRASRFVAAEPAFNPLNVEVAPDRIASFSFSSAKKEQSLLYDLQTQLDGNSRGRHGSGRSGIYLGHYLKGVGRTPAAANWNDNGDIYHASGHLSVGSAIRERLISVFLEARGLGGTIVPCKTVLAAPLAPGGARAVGLGKSSSRASFTPGDAHMIALTVKTADFARMSNFVFALDHFTGTPQHLGELFLDLERYLHPPGGRANLQGAPDKIADALNLAFKRGLQNFRAFARIGLFWMYLDSNFTLDGRFLDLETPVFFGAPFAGRAIRTWKGRPLLDLLGFEEFGFVLHWRLFIAWLKARLRFLVLPEMGRREARPFLKELYRKVSTRFSRRHILYRDEDLLQGATVNLADALGLGHRDMSRLMALARYAFESRVYFAERPMPDATWRRLHFRPAQPTPLPRKFEAPRWIEVSPSRDGEAFSRAIDRLGSISVPTELVQSLAKAHDLVPHQT
jgi:hypothetical protein